MRGVHTSVRDCLDSAIDEGGSGSVRVQINDIVTLQGVTVLVQDITKKRDVGHPKEFMLGESVA